MGIGSGCMAAQICRWCPSTTPDLLCYSLSYWSQRLFETVSCFSRSSLLILFPADILFSI